MYKNFNILCIACLLLAFFSVFFSIKTSLPSFAESAGELLSKYGFIKGDANGDLLPDAKLTREQLAILLCKLYGKSLEASRFKRPPNYQDAYRFPSWSRSYISYAQYMGWMLGGDERNFNNEGRVSDTQLAIALTKVLGYSPKDALEALSILESFHIKIPSSAAITRGEAFEAMWSIVGRPVMKNGKVLGEVIGRLQGDVSAFEVKEIHSDNFGFLVVEFNKPVDAVSVNRNSIELTEIATGEKIEISSVKVSGNRVFFVPLKRFAGGYVNCTISGINSGWGENDKMKSVSRRILIQDKGRPECIGLEFTGEREITLVFNEPIASTGNVRLRLGNINIGVSETGVKGLNTERITYRVFAALQDGKQYEVKTQYFKDLVGKSSAENSVTETYTKKKTSPVLQIGEQTAEYVELIFSVPVKGLEESKFYHTDSEKKPIKITAAPIFHSTRISKNDYIDRVYLWFYHSSSEQNAPIPATRTLLYVDERGITDGFNDNLKSGTFAIRSGEKEAKNRVESVTLESPDKLSIILHQKANRPVVRVKDERGKRLTLKMAPDTFAKEFHFRFEKSPDSKYVTVEIEASDQSLVPHKVEIRIGDKDAPGVLNVVKKAEEGGYFLHVYFSEEVDDSALLISNYQIPDRSGGKNIAGRISWLTGQNAVSILIPKSDYMEIVDKADEIYIFGIKDLSGNVMSGAKVKVINGQGH